MTSTGQVRTEENCRSEIGRTIKVSHVETDHLYLVLIRPFTSFFLGPRTEPPNESLPPQETPPY
jgi:hypothetical protein